MASCGIYRGPFFPTSTTKGVCDDRQEGVSRITVILGTRQGERQMMPDFGCRIHELLFAPNTTATARRARRYVEDALARWEPRIKVIDVRAVSNPSGSIQIEVSYKIPSTGQVSALQHVVTNR